MKNALKLISLMLALVMCLGVFAACGGEDKKENNKPTKGGTETAGGDEPAWYDGLNFGGDTIHFLVCDGDEATGTLPSRSIWVDPEGDLSFEVNAAVNDRNKEVEAALNVEIKMTACEQGQTGNFVTDSLSTGLHEYDIIGAYQHYDLGLTIGDNSGYFVNYEGEYEDTNYLNVDAACWDKELYDVLTYGGCAFWVSGDLSQTWISSIFVSFVNGEMWNTYKDRIAALPSANGISDPFELVNAGLWTMDLWMDISKAVYADTNSNEKVDLGDTVGFLAYSPSLVNIMADGLAAGAGIEYSAWVEDDWKLTFNNQKTSLFANKLYQLYNESNACLMGWDDNKYIMDVFADGGALMTVNQLHVSEQYLAEMQNFLVLPVPKLLAADKYSTTNHDNVTLFGIPYTTNEEGKLSAATATLQLMGELSYELVTPAYYENALKTRYTRYEEDMNAQGEMIDTIRASVYHDFASKYSSLIGSGTSITWFFRSDCGDRRFASKIAAKGDAWTTGLADVLEEIRGAYFNQM